MRKIIASVLAVVLVVCAFSTLSVSAAENLLSGKDCTFKNIAAWSMYPAADSGLTSDTTALFTDGAYRGDGTNAFDSESGTVGVTFDTTIAGPSSSSSFAGFYTFDLGESKEIAKIVIKSYREAHNRSWGQSNTDGDGVLVYVSDTAFDLATIVDKATAFAFPADGTNAIESVEKVAIEGAPLYGEGDAAVEQYFDATLNLTAGTTGRYILVKTNGMLAGKIFQADEIEAYGPEASAPVEESSEDSSEDVSDDASSDDVSADDSSDDDSSDDVEEIVIADPTYTVTYSVNEDGTANITVTTPEGVGNGKVLLAVSDKLALIVDEEGNASVSSDVGDTINVTDAGIVISFASTRTFPAGTVVLSADFTVAEGAVITTDDFNVPTWQLGDGDNMLTTDADGDVIKVMPPEEVEESSEEESSEVEVEPDVPNTGDLGIAVFAVLAVISAGAVVVLKKKA